LLSPRYLYPADSSSNNAASLFTSHADQRTDGSGVTLFPMYVGRRRKAGCNLMRAKEYRNIQVFNCLG